MSQESKFRQLKSDIYTMILKEISEAISRSSHLSGLMSSDDEITKCSRLLVHLDEATIKYLMKLTNSYIRAKRKQNEYLLPDIEKIFKKYGFDARILDEKITEIQYPYNLKNEMWPNKIQEEIMGIVFSHFECPEDFKLPKVDEILEIASKFGATYGATVHDSYKLWATGKDSYEIKWLDTSHFDDPYDTCGYFSTAIRNGLSIDEIIKYRKEIDTYMDYYSALPFPGSFSKLPVTIIVGELEEAHKYMSIVRAKKLYGVMFFRLNQENSRLNLQLSSLVSTEAKVTDEATDSQGQK